MGVRIALLVLGVFAAAWAWAGLHFSGVSGDAAFAPLIVSLALIAIGWRAAGAVPARGPRVGRLVGLWTGIEFVALFVAANILVRIGRPDLMLPTGAIIVGLHFFPLARGIPVPVYHATGAGLAGIGVVGLILPDAHRPLFVGLGAALVLWTTAAIVIANARQASAQALAIG
jgi:hypothetical protein